MINKFTSMSGVLKHLESIDCQPIKNSHKANEFILSPILTLANQIRSYCPGLPEKDGTIHVYIYGVSINEIISNGGNYKALNWALNTQSKWKIHLINKEIEIGENHDILVTLNSKITDQNIEVLVCQEPLDSTIERNGTPDLMVLNHPNIETHFKDLFYKGSGVITCLMENIPVVGASYGSDQVFSDQYSSSIIGAAITHPKANPFLYRELEETKATLNKSTEISMDSADWGGTIWQMENNGLKLDKEKLNFSIDKQTALNSIADWLADYHQIQTPTDIAENLFFKENGCRYIRIYHSLLLDIDKFELINEQNKETVLENIEVDCSDFDFSRLDLMHNLSMLIGTVYQDYVKDHIIDEPIELDEQEDAIDPSDLIIENRLVELESLPNFIWSSYINIKRQNLAHIAADYDNIEALTICVKKKVDLTTRDINNYSILDKACINGKAQTLKFLLEKTELKQNINDRFNNGFSAAHYAAMNGHGEIYKILESYGADMSLPTAAGITPSGIKENSPI